MEAYKIIAALYDESIYDDFRLAQPDEVWNFRHGDGVEKALLMANFLYNVSKEKELILDVQKEQVLLSSGDIEFKFHSKKGLVQTINLV